MADHILEMAELVLFLDYCFIIIISKIRLPMLNTTKYFYKVKNDIIPAYSDYHWSKLISSLGGGY